MLRGPKLEVVMSFERFGLRWQAPCSCAEEVSLCAVWDPIGVCLSRWEALPRCLAAAAEWWAFCHALRRQVSL